VFLGLSFLIWYSFSSYHNTKEHNKPMPQCKCNPLPEYSKWEILPFLSSLINHWILIYVLVIDILLKHVSEETMETCPKHIVKHGKPISPKDLTWVSVVESKVELGEDEDDVFVEIVTNHPTHSPVTWSSMN
jgi:hypothetical protein